jgi:ectoine hydroxylase-related dioxygenase (phytanoyl-CoA dioxygenase family)
MAGLMTDRVQISEAQRQQYRDEGYFILERVISDDLLALLRGVCQEVVEAKDAEMSASGAERQGITQKGKRYFISNCFREQPRLRQFLFSEMMADICRATLGDTAYLFWEQFVVKGTGGTSFSWHQDSGYVGDPLHKPYLTCWCALDDMSEANGTVHLLPFSQVGIRTWVKHERDTESNDLVGYFGSDPGITVECPAGSIAVFSSYNFHASGPNTTDALRRVYLGQYSCEPILKGDELRGSAEPLLVDGSHVTTGLAAPV